MVLTINQQKIVANEQHFEFTQLVLNRTKEGKLSAHIYFNVFDERGNSIGSDAIGYRGEEFNKFWTDFTSGTFLYQELAKKFNIASVEDKESDFVNAETLINTEMN